MLEETKSVEETLSKYAVSWLIGEFFFLLLGGCGIGADGLLTATGGR